MSDNAISIVLPVHDQADHISVVVSDYETALATLPRPHELILVANNCQDNSWEACQALAAKYPNVRAVQTERGGWGLAVKLGLQAARGDLLCYTNTARTKPADLLLLILYAIANPDTVIKAHRMSRESFLRKLGSFIYNLECRWLFRLPTWDINATPKVFSREIYNAIQPGSDGDLFDLEIYVKCKQLGKVILEVPIYSSGRRGGKSTTNFRSAFVMYRGAWDMYRSLRPAAASDLDA